MSAPGNPFSPRAVLALVVFGSLAFVALLYAMAGGLTGGTTNDGGAHAGGKGLNGYAVLADFLDRRGYAVRRLRDTGMLDEPGLLVLTPPAGAEGAEIDKIVAARRRVGPTLIITPKWVAMKAPDPKAKKGWVQFAGMASPHWQGFLDDVGVTIAPLGTGRRAGWTGLGTAGQLPDARAVQSGSGPRLVPLVVGGAEHRVLAAYVDDGGSYPALAAMAGREASPEEDYDDEDDEGYGNAYQPIVLIFEPDLLDNYGMADFANARLAERLVHAATGGAKAVHFDLTLNGFGRKPNLLTLAFTPPFLAATLCLLLAAIAVGWRAFLRFGPARLGGRTIAFGKRALVANAAGLIRRSRRLHLVTAPYATRARDRLVRVLALPRQADMAATEAAIDRALAARRPEATPFSVIAERLRAARSSHEIMKAAQDLHALERTLTQ